MIICNAFLPLLLWIKKIRTNITALFVISIFVNIGMWFERYVIIENLGTTRSGAVFEAFDPDLCRKVAIRVAGTSAPAANQPGESNPCFIREAQAIARLSHPNIVAVYRVSEIDGHPYLVAEFVRAH